jgi:hypothetical protein
LETIMRREPAPPPAAHSHPALPVPRFGVGTEEQVSRVLRKRALRSLDAVLTMLAAGEVAAPPSAASPFVPPGGRRLR